MAVQHTAILHYLVSTATLTPMNATQYTDVTVKELEGSEREITATIPAEILTQYRTKAIKELGSSVEVPGFRKGHVPEDMLIGHLGESRVMERAANMALSDIYPKIVVDEKIDALGSPRISITKLANGNALEFTATTAVMPALTLPNYHKIAKEVFSTEETFEVSDDEVAETLKHIRRERGRIEAYEKQKNEGVEEPQLPEIKDEDLPQLTDEFVQQLGDFKTVADFEKKVRENILEEKKLRGNEKKRIETLEKVIEGTKVTIPQLFINEETRRMHAQMEAQVAQTGTKFEDYLKNIKKTVEELYTEWKPEAEKRAKLQLILNAIAKEQNILPDPEEIQREVSRVKQSYPQADTENIRIYVETTKRNEMVLDHLEKSAK